MIQVDTYRQFTKLFDCTNVFHEDSFLRRHNQKYLAVSLEYSAERQWPHGYGVEHVHAELRVFVLCPWLRNFSLTKVVSIPGTE